MTQGIGQTIGIVGGGAWGTALAAVAARRGRRVVLWAREDEVVRAINDTRENAVFLPGIALPEGITATSAMADLAATDAVLMVTPAQHMREVAEALSPHLKSSAPVVICSKGIEMTTGALMSDVLTEAMPRRPLGVLSGPTFAGEVARGLPAAVTLACKYESVRQNLIEALGGPTFRTYASSDLVGAQIGGAVKNVIAIASGIVEGRKLGENARAALITRGMSEILRFGQALGAERETMMGLSGLGDMILTCSSPQSRNMSLGIALGEGRTLDDIMGERNSVSEGVHSARVLVNLAARHKVELPICEAVAAILHDGQPIDKAIDGLLNRPFGTEIE